MFFPLGLSNFGFLLMKDSLPYVVLDFYVTQKDRGSKIIPEIPTRLLGDAVTVGYGYKATLII